jgi:diaminopimelate decarboxylase
MHEPASVLALLPHGAGIVDGMLSVGGCRVDDLASRFGTPLYVYDDGTLRQSAREVLAAFRPLGARVSFAAKACEVIRVLRVFEEEGLDLDAVSEGELEAASRAGFDPDRIHLHGNNKAEEELARAIRCGLRAIVIDNVDEARRIVRLVGNQPVQVSLTMRVLLPVEAATHPHLQTSGERSKFGIPVESDEAREFLDLVAQHPSLRLISLHTHLGSQIADVDVYTRAADDLLQMAARLSARGSPLQEISLGGGWAVAYRPGDPSLSARDVAAALAPLFGDCSWRLAVEPGRALVARAGVAIYRVGSVKQSGSRRLVAVDGGMGDNPRPALYGARYSALPVSRPMSTPLGPTDVVGRYCESGDVLARDVFLPAMRAGDLICIPMSGAYQVSMASSYNLVPQPAVVLVGASRANLAVRRATVDDVLARDVP